MIGGQDVEDEVTTRSAVSDSLLSCYELEAVLAQFLDMLPDRSASGMANVEAAVDIVGLAPRMSVLDVERGDHQPADQHSVG